MLLQKRRVSTQQAEKKITDKLKQIELKFIDDFKKSVKEGEIREPFTDERWEIFENLKTQQIESSFNARITKTPIKQLLIFFSRSFSGKP
jgi:hypothetical protein